MCLIGLCSSHCPSCYQCIGLAGNHCQTSQQVGMNTVFDVRVLHASLRITLQIKLGVLHFLTFGHLSALCLMLAMFNT